jgi:hypothetical protein
VSAHARLAVLALAGGLLVFGLVPEDLRVTSRLAGFFDSLSAREVDCIVVAGQSNAVGFDADPAQLPASDADSRVDLWWRCGDPPPDEHDSSSGGSWTHLQAQPRGAPLPADSGWRQYGNFRLPAGGFGPEIGLGRALLEKQGRPLAIVKAAWNGTDLATDWSTEGAVRERGECFRALVTEVEAAGRAAGARGVRLRLRALVWLQGESDSMRAGGHRYEERLAAFVREIRRSLGAPEMTVLLGVNVRYGSLEGVRARMRPIIEAQKRVAATDPHCVYVDTDGAGLANHAHFDARGTLAVGERFAAALLPHETRSVGRDSDSAGNESRR